jgi:glycogen synthase
VKVAQLSTRYPPAPGGVERHVAELAPRLAALGHAVDVFTSDLYSEIPIQRLAPSVARTERVAFGTVHRIPVWSLPGDLHYPFFHGLRRALAEYRPDLVHVHTYGTNQEAVARRYRVRTGTPFVLTAHFHPIWSIYGGWLRHRLRAFYDHWLAGGLLASASRVIVQSHEEERLLRSLKLPLPPITIIPPGYRPLPAPPPGESPFADRYQIDGPYLLFVGRLASNKGLLELVEAFRPLAQSDRAARLVLVGEDGGMQRAILERTASLGLDHQVRLVGHVPDDALLAAAYREARALVLPSEYEAFGLVLLEALAQGRPVIASRVGGIPEFVDDGQAGLLVPPNQVPPLAAAIDRLWRDPGLADRMGDYGRREIVPRYTWDHLASAVDQVYREVARS